MLKPDAEQIEKLRTEMMRDMGEYTPEDKERIEESLKGVLAQKDVHNFWRETLGRKLDQRTGLSGYALEYLASIREMNPEEFDAGYKSKIDWNAVKTALEEDKKFYNGREGGDDLIRSAAALKEIFSDKTAQIEIDEELWRKIAAEASTSLNRQTKFGIAAAFKDAVVRHGIDMAANMKSFDEHRFSRDVRIPQERIEDYRKTAEDAESIDPRTRRILRILGIPREKGGE